MRRLVGGALIVAALGMLPARAETAWTCEQDGRIGGRQSGLCTTPIEPGSYQIVIEGLTRESSGELHLTVGEQLGAICTVIANLWSCEDGSAGAGQAEEWPTFTFDLPASSSVQFRVRPPQCGTVTCDREPQVITGRFRLTLATAPA